MIRSLVKNKLFPLVLGLTILLVGFFIYSPEGREEPSTSPFEISPVEDYWLLEEGDKIDLPKQFEVEGSIIKTENFLKEVNTEGVVVVKSGNILYENYYSGNPQDLFQSASATESLLMLFLGIAHEKGRFELDDKLTQHLPRLKETPYEDVKLSHLFSEKTGVDFDHKYLLNNIDDIWNHEKNTYEHFLNQDFEKLTDPGERISYYENPGILLGALLQEITDDNFSYFIEENFWKPLGARNFARWELEKGGLEVPNTSFRATLRDYARIGRMLIREGKAGEDQIISKEWIKSITTPLKNPALEEIRGEDYYHRVHFVNQWVVPRDRKGEEYLAKIGSGGFYLYLRPQKELVAVKTGNNPDYLKEEYYEKNISFLRKIAERAESFKN